MVSAIIYYGAIESFLFLFLVLPDPPKIVIHLKASGDVSSICLQLQKVNKISLDSYEVIIKDITKLELYNESFTDSDQCLRDSVKDLIKNYKDICSPFNIGVTAINNEFGSSSAYTELYKNIRSGDVCSCFKMRSKLIIIIIILR